MPDQLKFKRRFCLTRHDGFVAFSETKLRTRLDTIKEFAGLIELNNEGKYFFKIKEGKEGATNWGFALMESDDELQNVKCFFHSHNSLSQKLVDTIKQDFPNATDIEITTEFGNMTIRGEELSGFIYIGFFYDEGDKWKQMMISAISPKDIDNSKSHPNKPSLVFSPDFDEYCIIINGQIINPITN